MTVDTQFQKYGLRELAGHKRKVYTLAWSSNGKKLASGSQDQTIRIWPVEAYNASKAERAEAELKGHTDSVCHLAWKPNSVDTLASTTGGDKSIRLWDVRSTKCTGVVATNPGNIFVTWSPDGSTVAVANKDNTVSFVDPRKGKSFKSHKFQQEVNEIMWGQSNSHFMVATGEGCVDVMTYPQMEVVWSLKGHSSSCYCFAMSKDGKHMASGGADALVALWDLDSVICTRSFVKMDQPVRSISFSPDSQYLAFSSEDSLVEVVSVQSGNVMQSFNPRAQLSDSVLWNPVFPVLAFAEEREDNRERAGVISIWAPPK